MKRLYAKWLPGRIAGFDSSPKEAVNNSCFSDIFVLKKTPTGAVRRLKYDILTMYGIKIGITIWFWKRGTAWSYLI